MTQSILITGSASGIGNYLVHKFSAMSNYIVYALDINDTKPGTNVKPIKVDLRDENQTRAVFYDIPPIDIAINCAGDPSVRKNLIEFTATEISECWQTNFSMAFNATKHEIINMREQNKGRIINIASISAHKGMENILAYASAKASIITMTKIAAIENAQFNIKVNSISPATIDTPWIRKKYNGVRRDYSSVYYTNDCGSVNDVYSAVLMFTTNNFLTGHDLRLDGGITDLCKI
ncbi:SDR family oxidoreductase [Thiotrichales bacterium 19S11-10]|nr:SDR family oxidoreductase [Thiotrichales bacterium 19S11-10]